MKSQVGIIMGSDSDLPVMQEAAQLLDQLDVPYELTLISAHRTPERMFQYARTAASRGLKVIIAGAGGAAHLPGMVAATTSLPVIGVPIRSRSLRGVDSLYSIVQMPGGVPVATVAINGAQNAGILAVQILGVSNKKIQSKIIKYTLKMKNEVVKKALRLEKLKFKKYLKTTTEQKN